MAKPGAWIIPPKRLKISAPAWDVIPDQVNVVLQPIAPLDLSIFLNAGTPPFVFEDIGAQIPSGLVLDVNTGIVTGSPAFINAAVLVSIRATNLAGSAIGSFTWEITL